MMNRCILPLLPQSHWHRFPWHNRTCWVLELRLWLDLPPPSTDPSGTHDFTARSCLCLRLRSRSANGRGGQALVVRADRSEYVALLIVLMVVLLLSQLVMLLLLRLWRRRQRCAGAAHRLTTRRTRLATSRRGLIAYNRNHAARGAKMVSAHAPCVAR